MVMLTVAVKKIYMGALLEVTLSDVLKAELQHISPLCLEIRQVFDTEQRPQDHWSNITLQS